LLKFTQKVLDTITRVSMVQEGDRSSFNLQRKTK
jgi:hypothetical protein